VSDDRDIEFVAYSRKLLRELLRLKHLIESDNKEEALQLLDEMISDAEGDIKD